MRLRKAEMVDIVAFVMIFTMFTAFIVAFTFNNSTQERRGFIIDEINREAMRLQASLEGYSEHEQFCFIYKDGELLKDKSSMDRFKNEQIAISKARIENVFKEKRVSKLISIDTEKGISIYVKDEAGVTGSATVYIDVEYTAKIKMPYTDNDSGSDAASSEGVKIKDSASRTIENPIRAKNKLNANRG